MTLQACPLGWALRSVYSDPELTHLSGVHFLHPCSAAGLVGDCLVRGGQSKDTWGLSPWGLSAWSLIRIKLQYLLHLFFHLAMSLNSFCNFFNLCHIRIFLRATSSPGCVDFLETEWRESQHFFWFFVTFRVILFVSFIVISPKCFQEGATGQTELIDSLIRWSND